MAEQVVTFPLAIGDEVEIDISGETGVVIGLSIDRSKEMAAEVVYRAADGRGVTAWWSLRELRLAT